ncbi:hypothetical protein [Streptomyces sp. NPDC050738]|uniref:hypothetical protein n=1 Tax=Streptomyces sp. NPDC050738 TaxID=3154744 RepID=UPI00342715A3
MSDFEEQSMRKLSSHLSLTYTALVTVSKFLPIPVSLPTGPISNMEAIPAVRRAMALIEDQPLPEDVQAELNAAYAFWLAAMDVYALLATQEFHPARAMSAAACLVQVESVVLDLAESLQGLGD